MFLQPPAVRGYIAQYWIDARTTNPAHSFPLVFRGDGTLHIKLAGKYFFRLRGKKTGALYINGTQIISMLETDQEALIELKPGKHTIRIETLLKQPSDRVILEWMAPGDDYYGIVPAEHLSS